jgi:hypothetical protein
VPDLNPNIELARETWESLNVLRAWWFGNPQDPNRHDHYERLTPVESRLARTYLNIEPHQLQCAPIAIIIGEAPGPNTSPWCPMFPFPPKSAGGRLMRFSGMPPELYLRVFARFNLMTWYPMIWDQDEADQAAARFVERLGFLCVALERAGRERPRIVTLGVRVGEAFGQVRDQSGWWQKWVIDAQGPVECCAIPHPSARNRVYDDPQQVKNVGMFLRWAARL